MSPLVSIIVPVYNVDSYLKQCLDSVLNQTYKNIEILVVDDGSTDNSGKICDSYYIDSRVRVFHQSNAGVSAARNFALDHVKGEYIFFIDSDDFVHPDFIFHPLKALTENNADMVIFGHVEVKQNGAQLYSPPESLGLNTLDIKERIVSDDIKNYPCNKAFHRNLWNNMRFPQGRFEDLSIIPHVTSKATNIISLNEPLYYYRIHSASYLNAQEFNPARDYLKIQTLKSLVPLAKSYKDPQVLDRLNFRILDASIELAMLNYCLNELKSDEALTLDEYIKKDWNDNVLKLLGNKVAIMRQLIIHIPSLARLYGKFRYQRKFTSDTDK